MGTEIAYSRYGIGLKIDYQELGVCHHATEYRYYYVSFKEIKKYTKESRVKPLPLWKNPTSRSDVYRLQATCSVEKHVPLTGSWEFCGTYPILQTYKVASYYYTLYFGTELSQLPPRPDTDWALKTRLAIKSRKVNLAGQVAEFRETAGMFAGAAKTMYNAFRRMRRGHFLQTGRRLSPCDIASANLGLSFGVAPLLNDIYSSVLELKNVVADDVYMTIKVKAKARAEFLDQVRSVYLRSNGEWTVSDRVTAYVQFDTDTASNFTPGNPLEVAWEAVPYSFVIDWMVPVGDYLSSLDALVGIKNIYMSRSRKSVYKDIQTTPANGPAWELITPCRFTSERYERHANESIPYPGLPTWEPSQSYRSLINAVSLLVSQSEPCRRKPSRS